MADSYINQKPEDALSLSDLLAILWRGRWWLFGLAVISGLLAFGISQWVLPKKYRAVAYVSITFPMVDYSLTQGLTFRANPPIFPNERDERVLYEVARTITILESSKNDPRVRSLVLESDKWQPETKVIPVGNSSLRLEVVDTDPLRAATFATIWAESLVTWANSVYGLSRVDTSLEAKIAQAQQSLSEAQEELDRYLAQDQSALLEMHIASLSAIYQCLEKEILRSQILQARLKRLEREFAVSSIQVTTNKIFRLVELERIIYSLGSCDSPLALRPLSQSSQDGQEMTATQMEERLVDLRSELDSSIKEMSTYKEVMEGEITRLRVELEKAKVEFETLKSRRDQAKSLYEQLLLQQQLLEVILKDYGGVAKVSIEAQPPSHPVSPNPLFNAVVAAAVSIGFIGAILLLRHWS